MNLDELVDSVKEEKYRVDLKKWIEEWKLDSTDVFALSKLVEKWHGNVWFSDQQEQNEFYKQFESFKKQAIEQIGGMTVNERLYWFGLLNLWDSTDKQGQDKIRLKLQANA